MKIMRNQIILTRRQTPDYDWEKMTDQFVEEVKKKTDNNDYAVDNNYYNTYLKRPLRIAERF